MTNPTNKRVSRIDVVEAGQTARHGTVACELNRNIKFSTEALQQYLFVTWEPVIFDALLVAAAVEFCDKLVARPQMTWRRRFALRIPVHEVDRWTAAPTNTAIIEALQFLTGDKWEIEFVARTRAEPPPGSPVLNFPAAQRAVIPFSEGMDSRAVAGLMEAKHGENLVRVRMGKKTNDRPSAYGQRGLFTSVPYDVRKDKYRFKEGTGRSRGFKFAIVSGLTSYLLKADEIILPESGQGALGPVLLPVGQGYEDYRNHPLFTVRMERFLEALFGHRVRYAFPRLWHTKGETLRAYAEQYNGRSDWHSTRSCWQQSRHVSVEGRRRQCGVCAACMLRRLSVHAAGLTEAADTYVWESLDTPTFRQGAAEKFAHHTEALREYAIAGVLHMDHMADLASKKNQEDVVKRHAAELAWALKIPGDEAEKNLSSMLATHAAEWQGFLATLGELSFVRQWVMR